jgi:hypothetical protein
MKKLQEKNAFVDERIPSPSSNSSSSRSASYDSSIAFAKGP